MLKCSFCGKSQKQVKKPIAGPSASTSAMSASISQQRDHREELAEAGEVKPTSSRPPRSTDFLDQYVVGQSATKRRVGGQSTTTTVSRPASGTAPAVATAPGRHRDRQVETS
ncbi:hypothetical protein HBB16_05930 [Pseudonocardia sp. MCCB 268]|nr:hypothetical protein [Pseudonocardia cytotoxica]